MKLTERQKALRIIFRAHVIDKWADPAASFYSIFSSMVDGTEVTVAEIRRELSEIPSIGFIDWGWSVRPWLARHYPTVSDALFDTADKRIAMTLFVAKNYVNGKSALAEIKASTKRSEKKINEIRTLNSEKNVGRKHSPEALEKIRVAGRLRKQSDETKSKMRAAHSGKTLSTEHRAKLSASKLGKKLPPRTAEHSEKIAAGLRAAHARKKVDHE